MTGSKKTTYLLAGHGSRNREGNDEIEQFAVQWRAMHPDWRIEVCFIEHADILLNEGLDRAAQGADRVVLIPFILNHFFGHGNSILSNQAATFLQNSFPRS